MEHLPCSPALKYKTVFPRPANLHRTTVWNPLPRQLGPGGSFLVAHCKARSVKQLTRSVWDMSPRKFKFKGFSSFTSETSCCTREEPLPKTGVDAKIITCFFFLDLPSSPWWTSGIVISGWRAAPQFAWNIAWSALQTLYRDQNVRRTFCIDFRSEVPASRSNSSYSIRYFSHELNFTSGNSFLLSIFTLVIFTGKLCPKSRKTLWAPSSLPLRGTCLSLFNPFDETLVTCAWRMASRQETSACHPVGSQSWPMGLTGNGCS